MGAVTVAVDEIVLEGLMLFVLELEGVAFRVDEHYLEFAE